jgi:hypothetical protein
MQIKSTAPHTQMLPMLQQLLARLATLRTVPNLSISQMQQQQQLLAVLLQNLLLLQKKKLLLQMLPLMLQLC